MKLLLVLIIGLCTSVFAGAAPGANDIVDVKKKFLVEINRRGSDTRKAVINFLDENCLHGRMQDRYGMHDSVEFDKNYNFKKTEVSVTKTGKGEQTPCPKQETCDIEEMSYEHYVAILNICEGDKWDGGSNSLIYPITRSYEKPMGKAGAWSMFFNIPLVNDY